jgi:hypothetical protein
VLRLPSPVRVPWLESWSITAFSVTTLSLFDLFVTLSMIGIQSKNLESNLGMGKTLFKLIILNLL